MIEFLTPPFLMCLMLVGIHCYLGLHVLARGVIFVDLALAQVAALGSILPFLWIEEPSMATRYFTSLTATLLAAAFLTLANQLKKTLSQEALVGVVFSFCSAALILLVNQMTHGAEHIKHSMVGQLLWTTWQDIAKVFFIYSAVALCYFIWRRPLFINSFEDGSDWKIDLLFYGLFAVVITSSVQVAGILIVFSFLIVPALISAMYFKDIFSRLIFGWVLGTVLCLLGMIGSYYWDLPSGAFIVLIFSALPIVLVVGKVLLSRQRIR